MFRFIYILFVITALLYGNVYVGPLSLRQIMVLIMAVTCLTKKYFYAEKTILYYFVFMLFFLLSSIVDGYTGRAISLIIGRHVVCCVAFFATTAILKKNKGLETLFGTITVIGIFNAIVTIAQLYHLNTFDSLLSILHLNMGTSFLEDSYYSYHEVGEFMSAMPGLFESSVINGVFSSVAAVSSLFLIQKYKSRIIAYLPWLITLAGCFATQQRTAFVGSLAISLFCIYKLTVSAGNRKVNKYIIFVAIIGGLYAAYRYYITSGTETRYDDMLDMSSRLYIYQMSLDFIPNNLLLGGIYRFLDTYNKYPHNILFNAFIFSGVFGAIAIFAIYFSHIKKAIGALFARSAEVLNASAIIPAGIVLLLFAESLFHNQSIVTGDVLYWLFAAFFIYPRKSSI